MTEQMAALKDRADHARALYRSGRIDRKEALKEIEPYASAFNAKARELAAKYDMKPKLFSASAFFR